jgi:chemotaxis protein methyltransferase CheR
MTVAVRDAMTKPVAAISPAEFARLQSFVQQNLGIHLADGKMTMVEQRLRPMVANRGYADFTSFIEDCVKRPSAEFLTDFINRITTNHTYFNRESEHFRFLTEQALPEFLSRQKGQRVFRMWCAAASRGHEPYTLAMLQREFFGRDFGSWDAGLLATDISDQALRIAVLGRYPTGEVAALPDALKNNYLRRISPEEFEVIPELKRDVLFRKFNLHSTSYPFKKPFDVVFCRNVLIYFDMPTKLDVVRKIEERLVVGGYLFVGLAESLGRDVGRLRYVRPGIYKKA